MLSKRLEKIQDLLVCPDCKVSLIRQDQAFSCSSCENIFPINDEKLYFLPVQPTQELTIKDKLKLLMGKYYYDWGIKIVAPVFPTSYKKALFKHIEIKNKTVVEIGSGATRNHPDFITIDLYPYKEVDIVCDVKKLPFKDESIDAFVSGAVLEHVYDLESCIQQIDRCTKENGQSLHVIPFMYPYHESPNDYQRLTQTGCEVLFKSSKWKMTYQENTCGPMTLFLLCFIEFLSIIFSFGSQRLKEPVYLLFCLLLFPLKYLDFPFIRKKSFLSLAPCILSVYRKHDE